jgi:hypothetical protein
MKMNTHKGWITTFFLAVALMASTMTANAGTIIGGRSTNTIDPCTDSGNGKAETSTDNAGGTIIGGLTGTIIGGFAGTIIGGLAGTIIGGVIDDEPTVNCGVIIGG